MINGGHVILYSKDAEADRAFLKDVLGLPHVDVGEGWLIFGLPASEIAVHPQMEGAKPGKQELYFMCADIDAFKSGVEANGLSCSDVSDQGWGKVAAVTLPSGAEIGVYEPRHARPENPA